MELELMLDSKDRAELASTVATPGYQVHNKILKHVCDSFITQLLNTQATEPESVLINHQLAKVSAQIFTMIVNRVEEEMLIFRNYPKASDKPIDATEGVLDIGEYVSIEEVLDSVLEER